MAEVRKLGANDLQIGEGSVVSPAGKSVVELTAAHIPVAYGTANDAVTAYNNVVFSVDDAISARANVRAFGAVGDGTTDDTAAVQAAIDNCYNSATAPARRVVYFPAGTYRITSSLLIRYHHTQYVGDGLGGTDISILKADAGVSIFTLPEGSGNNGRNGIVFKGIKFQGQSATPSEYAFTVPSSAAPDGFWWASYKFYFCEFENLAGVFNYSGKYVSVVGLEAHECQFLNAPTTLDGYHNLSVNALKFYNCRWAGTTQHKTAFVIDDAAGTGSGLGLLMVAPIFEGNSWGAIKLRSFSKAMLINGHFEVNASDNTSIPHIDFSGDQLTFINNYGYTTVATDTFLGSSAVGVSYNLSMTNCTETGFTTPITLSKFTIRTFINPGVGNYVIETDWPVYFDKLYIGSNWTPASKTEACTKGRIGGDANYIYYCYADNNIIRVPYDNTW